MWVCVEEEEKFAIQLWQKKEKNRESTRKEKNPPTRANNKGRGGGGNCENSIRTRHRTNKISPAANRIAKPLQLAHKKGVDFWPPNVLFRLKMLKNSRRPQTCAPRSIFPLHLILFFAALRISLSFSNVLLSFSFTCFTLPAL